MHFSEKTQTTCSFQTGTKNPTKKKIIVEASFFTSCTITSEKCTRAHVQENKSIYLSMVRSIGKSGFRNLNLDFPIEREIRKRIHLREIRPQGGFQLRNPNPDFFISLFVVRLGNPKKDLQNCSREQRCSFY